MPQRLSWVENALKVDGEGSTTSEGAENPRTSASLSADRPVQQEPVDDQRAQDWLVRQHEELDTLFIPPEGPGSDLSVGEPYPIEVAIEMVLRFYMDVDPPNADKDKIRNNIKIMAERHPKDWQLKYFKVLQRKYNVEPRLYTDEHMARRERAKSHARALSHSSSRASRASALCANVGDGEAALPEGEPPKPTRHELEVWVASPLDFAKQMLGVVVRLPEGDIKLNLVREHIETAANGNPAIPERFAFIMDEMDRVTAKQEKKYALSTLWSTNLDSQKVVIAPTKNKSLAPVQMIAPELEPEPEPAVIIHAESSAEPAPARAATAFASASGLVESQDNLIRSHASRIALTNGDFLSNLSQRADSSALKYLMGGSAGRTVAETEAYLEAELEGTKKEPVAVTVWENERKSLLPTWLSSLEPSFGPGNLTFIERTNYSDSSGDKKVSDSSSNSGSSNSDS